ncbi:PH domain-containing protein [Streptomyces sp. NPDC051784]|uniref:PH domain-containing protein n=1 Tax=Streptomyces sp. NPDC051784 TaxID=3155805 RepID=UPI00341246B4
MTEAHEVNCRPGRTRALNSLALLGAGGAALAAGRAAYRGTVLDAWALGGLATALLGLLCLYAATVRVGADSAGLRSRTLLRRRSLPWRDVRDLGVHIQYGRGQEYRRVVVVTSDGSRFLLPLPVGGATADQAEFDATVDALRALHRRHGSSLSDHVPVLSPRTAGRSSAAQLVLCAVLLAGAGLAAWAVPGVREEREAWESATPCTATTPVGERAECLGTVHAVIARTGLGRGNSSSRLYFTDGRPLERISVSREGARGFHPGDRVELTVWRHAVRQVTGEHHVWREHFPAAGEIAVVAAGCALGAGFPAARVLLRLRGRRLPDDEVLPSALPFAGALAGTALWLLPLCYLHPASLFSSPGPARWAAAGAVVSSGLFAWAWRATRVREPEDAATGAPRAEDEEEFVTARFLDDTDYNPHGFGTHVVLGGGPPAVVPHSGPGRFAAHRIPVERLTLTAVRRPRGGDGDTVPAGWHIAELDDAGVPVRLAAAPRALARLTAELGLAPRPGEAPRARP